eukprot:745886-Hanusia_phi.AAC.1
MKTPDLASCCGRGGEGELGLEPEELEATTTTINMSTVITATAMAVLLDLSEDCEEMDSAR